MTFNLTCPVSASVADRILLAHGEGARLSRRLIREELLTAFANLLLAALADGATLPYIEGNVVMTIDSSVVTPLFFPGGDIGKLAIHGAINDLAVCGAEPLYLSVAFILEEGLPIEVLRRVVASMKDAAANCGIVIVTGDTKVVPRGNADQIFIATTGIGRLRPGVTLAMHRVQPGDVVISSGTIGDHGLAILAAREGLELGEGLTSDCAPLNEIVAHLLELGSDVHFLRDPTRGGVAAVMHELVEQTGLGVQLDESRLPISPAVRGASELLGLDPLHIANEGKVVAVVASRCADRAIAVLRQHSLGAQAAVIGDITPAPVEVVLRNRFGHLRVVDEPTGAPLPRIC
ncbi:MAG: hydrogenase expression/formation protein HypE [Planctomycetes bacterium]|nr:hydrogenase expression/formation protein HypE [Planctomycetota bacterium]